MNIDTKKIFDSSKKTLATATAAGALGYAVFGTGSGSLLGINLPVPLYLAGAVGLASGLYEGYLNHIFPKLPQSFKNSETARLLTVSRPVVTGVTAAIVLPGLMALSGGSVQTSDVITAFGLGAASEIVGSYIDQYVFDPVANIYKIKEAVRPVTQEAIVRPVDLPPVDPIEQPHILPVFPGFAGLKLQ